MSESLVEPNSFEVGWICALATEFVVACELLDEEYAVSDLDYKNDENTYTFGRIGQHKVVISCLPKGRYGITSAASVARDMLRSFPSIRFGLMVGIGGGVPSKRHDIRLGDIVVGCPTGTSGGVINYQYGKTIQGGQFLRTGSLAPPPRVLLSALNNLIAQHERRGHKIQHTVRRIISNPRLAAKYRCPGWEHDNLFTSGYLHPNDEEDCSSCCMHDRSVRKKRNQRPPGVDDPLVHYGLIASADSLMRDADVRDKLAKEADVLCFEMEAAGLMDHFPCLVIRGICDYCDTHKNKRWQGYAAAVAAAYAKELLDTVPAGERVQSPINSLKAYRGLVALTPLSAGSQNSFQVDIIAVHGLGGNAVSSWKSPSNFSWLRDWLARQNSNASILSYGYDSAVTWAGSKSPVCDTAMDLLQKLLLRPGRKFLFICHGLGGIIVKLALAMATSLPEHAYLQSQLLGLVFLGTPQSHLHAHEWMRIVYRMANALLLGKPHRMTIMDNLEQLSNTLALLSFEYEVDLNHVPILSCYETVPFADTGTLIVEPEAVILASAREQILPSNANHKGIAAPEMKTCEDRAQAYSSITAILAAAEASHGTRASGADLLQELYCVDYELYSVSVPDASPRTGIWLWDHPSFQQWASSEKSQLFWVRALPGYGKTVLAKGLTRDLKNRERPRSDLPDLTDYTTLSYFFREDNSAGTTLVAFLRSILHQILLQYPALVFHIQQAFNSFDNSTVTGQSVAPYLMPSALWQTFQSVLHNRLLGKVVLIIDGLDEADGLDIRNICHGLLQTIDAIDDQHRVKIFLTSRDSYIISSELQSSSSVETLDIAPEHTHRDIEIFLENTTAKFAIEHSVPESDIERIKYQISQKADGMFLWASLAWDHFKGGVAIWSKGTVQDRLHSLESLPPGLYALYIKLLQKIDKDVLQGLHAVFLIVTAAARPLTCEEAEQMLGIKGWETRTTDLDIPFSLRATIDIHCAGLLKISPAGVIRAVHLSLKDFLRDSLLKQQASALHSKIARDCIHYLTLADVREAAVNDVQTASTSSCLMRRFGFYDYAATYLRYHMNHVEPDDHVWLQYGSMVKHYAAFHTAVKPAHSSHVNTLSLTAPSYYAETPLRHAIRLHGTALIRTFASVSYDLDEKVYDYAGKYVVDASTALHSYIKKQDVVAELLACGASPNVSDYVQRTALHVAVLRGGREMVKMLLSLDNINVNVQDAEGMTALHYEATSGRGSLLLNDPRVNVDIRDNNGRTAVTSAASWGDRQTTLDFLRSRRNVMAQHDGELSLLIAAAQQNWLDITLEILSQLPDVSDHRGYDGKTILHLAVINDWEDVLLRAIVQSHAQVNGVDKRMRTPLHEAAEYGNFKLARKLIAHGASARCRDQQGRTPLQLAAIEGFADTVRALMNSDFYINDADKQQRTIVHWAASWDWSMIMQSVIEEPEANLLKHDCMGRTALHVAALCGCPNVLKLLIDENIFDVNETDCVGNSLLHLAARGRSSSVTDVLLQSSCFTKAHSVNKYGQTALDVAVAYGAEVVVGQLRRVPLSEQRVADPIIQKQAYYLRKLPELKYDSANWQLVHRERSRSRNRAETPVEARKRKAGEDIVLEEETTPMESYQRPGASGPAYDRGPYERDQYYGRDQYYERDQHYGRDQYHERDQYYERDQHHERDNPSRPVYIKCHTKYLLPQTLDEYHLPWEWDRTDPNYIIIKQYISSELQDELFDHTKMLLRRHPPRLF